MTRSRLSNWLLVPPTLVLCLGIIEFRLRFREGAVLSTENLYSRRLNLSLNSCGNTSDPHLGWLPDAGKSGRPNKYKTRVTLQRGGFRGNGEATPPSKTSYLAVGDSFTFGDQVSDNQTWPALLERLTSHPVLNAGVCGYGMDQSLLRAEKLLREHKPEILIYGFFSLGLTYNEWASQSAPYYLPKPYFEIRKDGSLALQQSPTPKAGEMKVFPDTLHQIAGYSYLVERVATKVAGGWWRAPYTELPAQKTRQDGVRIACGILKRLHILSTTHKVRVIALMQYGPEPSAEVLAKMLQVQDCAADTAVEIVDTWPVLHGIAQSNAQDFAEFWVGGHMSEKGNRLVARLISEKISGRPLSGTQANAE